MKQKLYVQPKHCDDYINDPDTPLCLKRFLRYHRWPAVWKCRAHRMGVSTPSLFATYKTRRVRITMASRFGDVGITYYMTGETGSSRRVPLEELSEFNDKPVRPK